MIIGTIVKRAGSLLMSNLHSPVCLLKAPPAFVFVHNWKCLFGFKRKAHSSLPLSRGCAASVLACYTPRLCPHRGPPPCRGSSRGRGNGQLRPRRHRGARPAVFAAVKTARNTRDGVSASVSPAKSKQIISGKFT